MNDLRYFNKWNFSSIFDRYTGQAGYIIFQPYPGGFNNVRLSLELAVCLAYIFNKTLVMPPPYKIYLLSDVVSLDDFFDMPDIGIKTIPFEEYAKIKNIPCDITETKNVAYNTSDEFNSDFIVHNQTYIDTTDNPVPHFMTLSRKPIKLRIAAIESTFFYRNLFGIFYLMIHSDYTEELKKLIAKHVRYNPRIFNAAEKMIDKLGDKNYYAVHIRRGDFQYKQLKIPANELMLNLTKFIPYGAVLYVATDHDDEEFFKTLKRSFILKFFNDVQSDIDHKPNDIPMIEQLICSRSIRFISNYASTLSNYVMRLRYYMNDIEDKEEFLNHDVNMKDENISSTEMKKPVSTWLREFKDVVPVI